MSKQCMGQRCHTQAIIFINIAVHKCRHTVCVHVYVHVCVYSPDLSQKLLLYECTGRVCGEVKTSRAHPVWDSPCPVLVPLIPKHRLTHTHTHTHKETHWCTFTLRLIIPYVLTVCWSALWTHAGGRTGAHLLHIQAQAYTYADWRVNEDQIKICFVLNIYMH